MTLSDREKLAFAIGQMIVAHWHNFHDFNYNPTFLAYLGKIGLSLSREEAIEMNSELRVYFEDLDYKLTKGMNELIEEDKRSKHGL